jgi:hypothetical protein
VQALIDAALAPVLAELAEAVKIGAPIAVKSYGTDTHDGMYLCAEGGGPERPGDAFALTARASVSVWESWTVARGKP